MPYIPSDILWTKINSLVQGFFISKDPKYVICIKLEPTIINSILNGCLIEVGLIKEYYGIDLTMLLIEDIPGQPFFIIGENFSNKSKEFNNYDEVVIDLFEQKEIILALFNLDSMPIYSKILTPNIKRTKQDLSSWLKTPVSNHKNLKVFDPRDIFTIDLENSEDKKEDKSIAILKLEPFSFERGKFEVIETLENETKEGKHGYAQEFSIRNTLLTNFEINKSYFVSPKKNNGEELTDSLLILDKCLLLFESKYVISEKQNKKNQALKKAIQQLDSANKYLQKTEFNGKLYSSDFAIIEICIVDTKFIHYFSKFPDELFLQNKLLPIVFTVSSFTQFIGTFIIEHRQNFKPYFEEAILDIWKDRALNQILIINPV